jgi:hypothetical protein
MAWSISKDDDGLEPALPRAGYGNESKSVESTPPRLATVVVDPISQIPQSREQLRSSSRRAEPTRILSARKMDQLRAQVLKQQRRQHRRKWIQLVTWGAAGAFAVALGGILAGGVLPRLDAKLWDRLLSGFGEPAHELKPAAAHPTQTQVNSAVSGSLPVEPAEPAPRIRAQAQPAPVSLDELEAESP